MKHLNHFRKSLFVHLYALLISLISFGFSTSLNSQSDCNLLITIANSGTCPISLYLNDTYMKDIKADTFWSGGVAVGDIWSAVSTVNTQWREDYTVTADCFQRVIFSPSCEIPCEIDFDIANIGECDVKIYRNGQFFRNLKSKLTWQGTTDPNNIWVATSATNPGWNLTYQASEECDQVFRIDAQCSPSRACQPIISIINTAACGVDLYLNNKFKMVLNQGHQWGGPTNLGDRWAAISKGDPSWSYNYTANADCNQTISLNLKCQDWCSPTFIIKNNGQCEVDLYRNNRFFLMLPAHDQWSQTASEGDQWTAISREDPNWSYVYNITKACIQRVILDPACSEDPCEKTLFINNNGLCSVNLYANDQFKMVLNQGRQWGGPVNIGDVWKSVSVNQPNWSRSHTVTTDCSQTVNLDPDCTFPCDPTLSITNKGTCDVELYVNDEFKMVLNQGHQWGGPVNIGDVWKSVSVNQPNWTQSHAVSADCNQTVDLAPDCSDGEDVCMEVNSTSFEDGWGIWNDGGYDAHRLKHTINSSTGDYSIKLKDNSGAASSLYTQPLRLDGNNQLNVTFSAITKNFSDGEDFFVDLSLDGGGSYQSYHRIVMGTHFNNGERKTYNIGFDIDLTDETLVRLRCDASSNEDAVYIDDVTIEACGNAGTQSRSQDQIEITNEDIASSFSILSNVVYDEVRVATKGQLNLSIIGTNGQVYYNENTKPNTNLMKINTSGLSSGMYFLRGSNQKGTLITKRFIKQ